MYSREKFDDAEKKVRETEEEKRKLEEARQEVIGEAQDEAVEYDKIRSKESMAPDQKYGSPNQYERYSRDSYGQTLIYLNEVEKKIRNPRTKDEDALSLVRRRMESREELNKLVGMAKDEAAKEDVKKSRVTAVKEQFTGQYLNDLRLMQELFERHFKNGFGDHKPEKFTSNLPGVFNITINYRGDRLLVTLSGIRSKDFIIYTNGKIEGTIPKEYEFGKLELLEEILVSTDTIRDAFYEQTINEDISVEDMSDFMPVSPTDEPIHTFEGEVVPPDELEEKEWRGGESVVGSAGEDYRRLQFYKELPGVCMTFKGLINSRKEIEKYGTKGIPYRGYVFPDYVVLDCHEIKNAIFVRKLDEPLDIPKDKLALPVTERMTLEEKTKFEQEIWTRFKDTGKKSLLKDMGFTRMYHPETGEDDPEYFRVYFKRLSRQIDFSQYGNIPSQYADDSSVN